jgi:polyferredoxin
VPQQIPGSEDAAGLDFTLVEDETILARTLARTSWTRVLVLLMLLVLVSYAFATKGTGVRLATLAFTLVYLGFFDGGFLSVSHITAGIAVGPAVYLNDIPLLLIVGFTLVTTLLWGRVFCGFLCPFGALQDFMEKVVPKRIRREPPQWVHDRAVYIKYGILAVILIPSLAGSRLSIFQYFEPFGTVFFLSPSLVLWTIAAGILAACVVVPRFYCRYACPLGAALGVVSFVSPFRIRRVEQCNHCKVCETACPTGAIRGPEIDFKECVRCNICETKLIERAGVCKHDIQEVERRLIQVGGRSGAVMSDG